MTSDALSVSWKVSLYIYVTDLFNEGKHKSGILGKPEVLHEKKQKRNIRGRLTKQNWIIFVKNYRKPPYILVKVK